MKLFNLSFDWRLGTRASSPLFLLALCAGRMPAVPVTAVQLWF